MAREQRTPRRFEFVPTPSVLSARARAAFISCPACETDSERYLFHKLGVRFVRCRSCGVVYANPPVIADRHYFDVDAVGQHDRPRDRELFRQELEEMVRAATERYEALRGHPAREVVLAGRTIDEGVSVGGGMRREAVRLTTDDARRLSSDGDVTPILTAITSDTSVLILNELLEACPLSASVVRQLAAALPDGALVVVVFNNVGSAPARALRRHWTRFFAWKSVYFDTDNLARLMDRCGLRLVGNARCSTAHSGAYVVDRLGSGGVVSRLLGRSPLGSATVRLPLGTWMATFEKVPAHTAEMLSIVVPVFNEKTYISEVLDALLAKELSIPKEVILVESNSTDGTREIVQTLRGHARAHASSTRSSRAARAPRCGAGWPQARARSSSSRTPTSSTTSTTTTPCSSRSCSAARASCSARGRWASTTGRCGEYARSRVKAFLMNFAQLLFAKTFNVLYQQRMTDINTMFKVFRRECIEGIEFRGAGFNFDIELVCKIVSGGFARWRCRSTTWLAASTRARRSTS